MDESGGLRTPGELASGPDGLLYVCSPDTDEILRFDALTGVFIDAFVTDHPDTPKHDESGGLQMPAGIAFGPDGQLYVSSQNTDEILRFDAHTGAFIDTFVPRASGGLGTPGQLVIGPDGWLYVASLSTHEILRYDPDTGAFIDVFVDLNPDSLGSTRQMSLIFMRQ